MTSTRQPVPVRPRAMAPSGRRAGPVASAIARRAVPILAASTGTLVATLAAERALARLVMTALSRAGQAIATTPFSAVTPGITPRRSITRVVVTETTVIERISRRR